MHNRDLIWNTTDGRSLKIRNIGTTHLCNILKHIDKNIDRFIELYGKKSIENYKNTIEQEIRLRKLNRLEIDSNEELF